MAAGGLAGVSESVSECLAIMAGVRVFGKMGSLAGSAIHLRKLQKSALCMYFRRVMALHWAMIRTGAVQKSQAPITTVARSEQVVAGSQIATRASIVLTSLLLAAWIVHWTLHGSQQDGKDGLTVVMRAAPHLDDPSGVDATVEHMAAAGVTHVLLQVKQDESDEHIGGEVFFPSAVAPVAEGYHDDRLGRLIDALVQRGVRVSAWMPTLHDPAVADRHVDWRAWWLPAEGSPEDQQSWLCPASGEAINYEASIACEVLDQYPALDGLYLDFIRFDSDFSCVCDRCLREFDERLGWSQQHGHALVADDIRQAGAVRAGIWEEWTEMRAERICDAVDVIRDRVDEVRPGCWIGACVLPFSATDYSMNTQSGQDFFEMARAGLDEIVLMGYWDDWDKSPRWLTQGLGKARQLVEGECQLSCLIDGDMSMRRTLLTLDAVHASGDALDAGFLGFFNYGSWNADATSLVRDAVDRHELQGATPRPSATNVVIRIDTEPDYMRSYDTVSPAMIRTLMDMFEAEGVRGTFITCARLAELQGEIIQEAAARGHEIGMHAYDHEQLDSLGVEEQLAVLERSRTVFQSLGVPCAGFGAPRNSITDASRDRLIEFGLQYDGSEAYDPMYSFVDARHVAHSARGAAGGRILVVPFVYPNDWDARHIMRVSAEEMLDMWKVRLNAVIESGEPVFVLDIHQWLASQDDNLDAVREFIRYAKSLPRTEVTTLAQTAAFIKRFLMDVEPPASAAMSELAFEARNNPAP